jgi:hypothetical protein
MLFSAAIDSDRFFFFSKAIYSTIRSTIALCSAAKSPDAVVLAVGELMDELKVCLSNFFFVILFLFTFFLPSVAFLSK